MINGFKVKVVEVVRKYRSNFFIDVIVKIYFKILSLSPNNIYIRFLTFYKCKRKMEFLKLKFSLKEPRRITLKVDGTTICFPNSYNAFMFINEQETFDNYRELNGLNCILDLGANVGGSAYYLQKRNKKILCYEASPLLFSYLRRNVESWGRNNIEIHNNFVKVDNIRLQESELKSIWNLKGGKKIKPLNLENILENHKIDGLKMDIEGGEYPIVEYFLRNQDKFTFTKGTIEFHFLLNEKYKSKLFLKFLKFLRQNGYKYYFLSNQHKKVSEMEVRKCLNRTFYIINIHFTKVK